MSVHLELELRLCEPPNMGAGNGTQVLCESPCSYPLSTSPTSSFLLNEASFPSGFKGKPLLPSKALPCLACHIVYYFFLTLLLPEAGSKAVTGQLP